MQTYVYLLKLRWLRLLFLLASLAVGATPYAFASPPPGGRHAAPPTPGNYVFQDKNQNGIFDGTDTGISSVTVSLYRSDGLFVENAVTDVTGKFTFTSVLQPNTSYDIRVRPMNSQVLTGLKLTTANQGSNDDEDSDATMVGSTAVITAVTNSSASAQFTNYLGFGYQASNPDLIITKTSNSFSVTKGATSSFAISVSNVGGSTAAGVVVRDTLDAGMGFVSASPIATTALLGSGQVQVTWGSASTTLGAGESLNYTLTVVANTDGVLTNVAAVTATTPDITPQNNVARACFTVPVKLCAGESYVTSLTASALSNVEWFRNGVSVGTGTSLTITLSGTYSYTSSTSGAGCQTSSCCPLIIYDGAVVPPTMVASASAICYGETVSLTASNCAGTLAWSTGETSATITKSPLVTTTYSVTCTPTADNACPASSSMVITVNPAVTATVASQTICYGENVTLAANASGGSNFTYSWAPSAAISGSNTGASIVANPTATTTYTVTVTNEFGCSNIATATVTVNPAVTATVANQTMCYGTSATLTVNATGGSNYTYAWTPTANITSGQGTASIVVNPSATTTYSVVVTNGTSCSTIATATVTVNPAVTATVASRTICYGENVTLTANASGGSGFTYAWSPSAAISGATNTASITANPTATTTYTVVVTNSDGCVETTTATVTVNPAVTLVAANTTICDGTNGTLSVAATGGSNFTYNWTPNTNIVSGQGTASIVVNPSATTTYTVVVTNGTSCSNTTTATVTVNPAVTAVIAVSPSRTICEGNTVTMTASGGTTYRWSTGATTAAITELPTNTAAANVYSVTVTSGDGCVGVASTSITVNPTPQLTVNSPTICQDQEATLTVTGCAGTLTWSTGTTGATLTVSPLQTTVYSATCVLSTGCSATTSTTVTVTPAPSVQRQDVVATRATCNGSVANSDASISLTNLQNVAKASISVANGTTVPDFANATTVTGNAITFGSLPNPTQAVTYLVRLYGATGCSTDVLITLDPAECVCPTPKCVPIVIRKIR